MARSIPIDGDYDENDPMAWAARQGLITPNPSPGLDVNSYVGSRYAGNRERMGATPAMPNLDGLGIDVNSYSGSMWERGGPGDGLMPSVMGAVMDAPDRVTSVAARKAAEGGWGALTPREQRRLHGRMRLEGDSSGSGYSARNRSIYDIYDEAAAGRGRSRGPSRMDAAEAEFGRQAAVGRQRLSALDGMIPGRSYGAGNIARASNAQVMGELSAFETLMDRERENTNTEALMSAFGLGAGASEADRQRDGRDLMGAFLTAGGRDVKTLDMLGRLPGRETNALDFVEDPVTGQRFALGRGGNFASSGRNPDHAVEAEFFDIPRVSEVDGVKFYQTGPRQAAKPLREKQEMDPMALAMYSGLLDNAVQRAGEIEGESPWFSGGKADKEKRLQSERVQANAYAKGLGYPLPYPDASPTGAAGSAGKQDAGRGTQDAAKGTAKGAAETSAKLYSVKDGVVSFGENRSRLIEAMQQAVNDGVISADAAREQLRKLGYKPKAKGEK